MSAPGLLDVLWAQLSCLHKEGDPSRVSDLAARGRTRLIIPFHKSIRGAVQHILMCWCASRTLQITPDLKSLGKLKLECAYSFPVLLSESCTPELTVPSCQGGDWWVVSSRWDLPSDP